MWKIVRRAILLSVVAMVQPVSAQTDLSAFEGANPDRAMQSEQCNAYIATSKPFYFPFCGTVITLELGDEEFKNFYEGDGNYPFLTHSNAVQLAKQTDRINSLRDTAAPCKSRTLENCVARLSKGLFVTSHPKEPEWVSGEHLSEVTYLHFSAFKPPVYDELRRLDHQSEREIKVMMAIAPGEIVKSITINQRWRAPSITNVLKTGFPETLSLLGEACGRDKAATVEAIKSILAIDRNGGENGNFGQKVISLCGQSATVSAFEAESEALSDQMILITVRAAL